MRVAIQKKFTHNFKLASPLGYIKGFGDPKRQIFSAIGS